MMLLYWGGGLAGLTLSLQLKNAKPDLSILVLERRENEATTAAHKVGESTVELGTHYLRKYWVLKIIWKNMNFPNMACAFSLNHIPRMI